MNLVITGGGTGGHIFGGVAIAQEFCQQSKAAQVLFIGSEYGLETKLVPKAGYRLKTIRVGKLVGQNIFKRLLTLLQIPIAIFECVRFLKEFKADMVIGVGGYAAGPCMMAAWLLGIPVGLLEQNSVMGFTNKIAARFANFIFTAFNEIPSGVASTKCIYTGNPSRSELKPVKQKNQKPFVVFAFGGSQGATGINKIMTDAAHALLEQKSEFLFIHQTGEKDFEWVNQKYKDIGFPAEVYRFIDNMGEVYSKASVVVCRAGSSTISELGATANAAVFIPFPFAARNHQEINAKAVEAAGAAQVLFQDKNSGADLANLLLSLANKPLALEKMRTAMAEFYRPDAAKRIIEVMKTHFLTKVRI